MGPRSPVSTEVNASRPAHDAATSAHATAEHRGVAAAGQSALAIGEQHNDNRQAVHLYDFRTYQYQDPESAKSLKAIETLCRWMFLSIVCTIAAGAIFVLVPAAEAARPLVRVLILALGSVGGMRMMTTTNGSGFSVGWSSSSFTSQAIPSLVFAATLPLAVNEYEIGVYLALDPIFGEKIEIAGSYAATPHPTTFQTPPAPKPHPTPPPVPEPSPSPAPTQPVPPRRPVAVPPAPTPSAPTPPAPSVSAQTPESIAKQQLRGHVTACIRSVAEQFNPTTGLYTCKSVCGRCQASAQWGPLVVEECLLPRAESCIVGFSQPCQAETSVDVCVGGADVRISHSHKKE
jgi:hypothetical protein